MAGSSHMNWQTHLWFSIIKRTSKCRKSFVLGYVKKASYISNLETSKHDTKTTKTTFLNYRDITLNDPNSKNKH